MSVVNNKFLLLALITVLALAFGAMAACGDDDDDDDTVADDDTADDDTAGDDDDDNDDNDDNDTAGDDDTTDDECATNYTYLYDVCGLAFYDADEIEIALGAVIDACSAGDENYGKDSDIYACIDENDDCVDIEACLTDLFS
ncbi:MAG: hypothetical protein P9L99_15310 [Candidatus Lernaella stagnicola]|nr:hypothetical protein [Candidatus Lernaella stagnicola]